MTRHLLASLLLTLSAAALHSQAHAAGITQSVGFRDVQLGVIDLTPGDDAAAGYTIDQVVTSAVGSTYSNRYPDDADEFYETIWEQVSWTDEVSYRSAFVRGQMDSAPGNLSFTASIGRDEVDLAAHGYGTQYVTLILAAHSMLTISGERYRDVQMDVASTAGFDVRAGQHVTVRAGTTYWEDWTWYDPPTASSATAERFWYSVANTSDVASTLTLEIGAVSWMNSEPLTSAVTAVPEPSTWAMLLTGLGVSGVFVRARRTGPGRD